MNSYYFYYLKGLVAKGFGTHKISFYDWGRYPLQVGQLFSLE